MLPAVASLLLAACGPPVYDCTDPLEPQRPPEDNPTLHQEGELLVDGAGDALSLRAVNLGGWLLWEAWLWGRAPDLLHLDRQAEAHQLGRLAELYGEQEAAAFQEVIDLEWVTAADLEAIAALGFNAVRLPLNHTVVEDEERLLVVDALLDAALAAGLWVVLDLHAAPGGQSTWFPADPDEVLLWEDSDAQARTVAIWAALAWRYAGHPAVAAYDLLNEPLPDDEDAYVDLLVDLIGAVRANDPDHLVMVEGTSFARDFRPFTFRLDENMAYEGHLYTALDGKAMDRVAGFAELATCHDAPVWVGEMGEDRASRVEDLRREIEDHHLAGWAFWPWKKVPSGSYPGLAEVDPPADWTALMEDLTAADGSQGSLTWTEAQAALWGFVEAARPGEMTVQEATVEALVSP